MIYFSEFSNRNMTLEFHKTKGELQGQNIDAYFGFRRCRRKRVLSACPIRLGPQLMRLV